MLVATITCCHVATKRPSCPTLSGTNDGVCVCDAFMCRNTEGSSSDSQVFYAKLFSFTLVRGPQTLQDAAHAGAETASAQRKLLGTFLKSQQQREASDRLETFVMPKPEGSCQREMLAPAAGLACWTGLRGQRST